MARNVKPLSQKDHATHLAECEALRDAATGLIYDLEVQAGAADPLKQADMLAWSFDPANKVKTRPMAIEWEKSLRDCWIRVSEIAELGEPFYAVILTLVSVTEYREKWDDQLKAFIEVGKTEFLAGEEFDTLDEANAVFAEITQAQAKAERYARALRASFTA